MKQVLAWRSTMSPQGLDELPGLLTRMSEKTFTSASCNPVSLAGTIHV